MTIPLMSLEELAVLMAQGVVSEPDQVKAETIIDESIIVIELTVAPNDIGRIIGKEGRVANAMRTILRTSAAYEGKRVVLEIL